jgi:hypothetical protein
MAYRAKLSTELQNPYVLFLLTMFGAAAVGHLLGRGLKPLVSEDG